MWIEKLTRGVLEIDTPIGSRYVQPSLLQRASLIWTFRNFGSLPQQVLRPWQCRLVDQLCSENRFVSFSAAKGEDWTVIGRVERRIAAQAEASPARKPAAVQPAVAEPSREAASA